MLFLVLMLPPKPRPRLPMQSGHGSASPASGVVHGHPDRWCSRHCRRPSRALRRVCAVSTAARQFDVQPVFAALAICSRCETRLIPGNDGQFSHPRAPLAVHELCSQQHRHLLAVRPRPQEGPPAARRRPRVEASSAPADHDHLARLLMLGPGHRPGEGELIEDVRAR